MSKKDAQIERDDWMSLSEGSGSDLLKEYKKELKGTKKDREDGWWLDGSWIWNFEYHCNINEEEITLLEEEKKGTQDRYRFEEYKDKEK